MQNKINIAKILKNCPRDMELDCTMYENVYFDYVDTIGGINCYIKSNDGCLTRVRFLENGCYTTISNAKCVIFPKGKTTWEGFHKPFEDMDVVISDKGDIHLLRTEDSSYCAYRKGWDGDFDSTITTSIKVVRHATEEEKAKLFQTIQNNGYKWNENTKTLEELIKPNFKVGDRVKKKDSNEDVVLITDITDNYYIVETEYGMEITISINIQNNYELVPNKFDISNLKPFDNCRYSIDNGKTWEYAQFWFIDRYYNINNILIELWEN